MSLAEPTIAPPRDDYWEHARSPLASLIFIAPWLVFYELGVLWLGPDSARNGADAWLRGLLYRLGFAQYFLLPAATVLLLLAWHHMSRRRWKLSAGVFTGMLAESVAFAVLLLILAQAQNRWLVLPPWQTTPPVLAAGIAEQGLFARLVGFAGAGIYEELLFRLMLLPAVAWLFRSLGASLTHSIVAAVIVTSVLFAGAHYLGPLGDVWQIHSFVFRTLAGIYFSVLFVYRGFGIAAGAHAIYDVMVGILLAA